jgi:hypothetical protein
MKAKKYQALIMVAFAWVLWTKFTGKKNNIWELQEGYENKAQCSKSRDSIIFALKRKGMKIEANLFLQKEWDNKVTFHCVSDAIDPRPSKNK